MLFGEGQQWLGLVAGGALVFAIAPLQRMADRLAEKAVPLHGAKPTTNAPGPLQLYRELAKRLAADGVLSPADRRTLAYVAQEMRLGAGQMHRVLERIDAKL